jgi:uncharacterized protein involved in exopolysaccharide biosynthesis
MSPPGSPQGEYPDALHEAAPLSPTAGQAAPGPLFESAESGIDGPEDAPRPAWPLIDLAIPLAESMRLLLLGPVVVTLLAFGATFLVSPTFTARTIFVPPQQQNSGAAQLSGPAALQSLAGIQTSLRNPTDQFVSLAQSTTIADRIIDRFKLIEVYDKDYRADARKLLGKRLRASAGKKDGLVTLEVDDDDPQRSADMANAFVDELRRLSSQLALTEAQQRRVFFENQLAQTRERLNVAQLRLESSGFGSGALRSELRSASESYARLRADIASTEVRLQTLRGNLTDSATEVQTQLSRLQALRTQLARAERPPDADGGPDYLSKYREFKYNESLLDFYSRQYELARLDESREGSLIQVVDIALRPEKKTSPHRGIIALACGIVSLVVFTLVILLRDQWRESMSDPSMRRRWQRLRSAIRRDSRGV